MQIKKNCSISEIKWDKREAASYNIAIFTMKVNHKVCSVDDEKEILSQLEVHVRYYPRYHNSDQLVSKRVPLSLSYPVEGWQFGETTHNLKIYVPISKLFRDQNGTVRLYDRFSDKTSIEVQIKNGVMKYKDEAEQDYWERRQR